MGHYFDSDDVDFAILASPGCGSWPAAIVTILMIAVCAGLATLSSDECSDKCAAQSPAGTIEVGRVIENECYCVRSDGDLHALKEPVSTEARPVEYVPVEAPAP